MRKTLLVVLFLIATFKAHAVPIVEVWFYQDNWFVAWEVRALERPNDGPVEFYIDGSYRGTGSAAGHADWLTMQGDSTPGTHTTAIRYYGTEWTTIQGPSFFVETPTGPRPTEGDSNDLYDYYNLWQKIATTEQQSVPETGGSLALLALGMLGLMSFGRHSSNCRRTPAR